MLIRKFENMNHESCLKKKKNPKIFKLKKNFLMLEIKNKGLKISKWQPLNQYF